MSNCGCKKTPCGCKSATTTAAVVSGGGCGCGGGGCATCVPRAFMRPRFFAGQLLTEDDLALLGDYVVAKNRLHNRSLWGPGVVCGLDVHCDPCGGGNVIVQPGYAINCCGDDIVVPCPESVDILELIRELKHHTSGGDCADPCDQPRLTTSSGQVPNPKAPIRSYYLYVRYEEQLTDPVSPYATGEPCAGQACEPTRVREGHRYELRCTDDNPHFPGLGDRLRACIGDIVQVRTVSADATALNRIATHLDVAQRALLQTPQPVFTASDVQPFEVAVGDLGTAIAGLQTPDTAKVRAALEGVRVAGSLFARYQMTPAEQRPRLDAEAARKAIANGVKATEAALGATGVALDPLETVEAKTMLALVGPPSANVTTRAAATATTLSQQLWAYGAPLDAALYAESRAAQQRIAAFLAPRLAVTRLPNDCQLVAQFDGIRPVPDGEITVSSVNTLAASGTTTSQILARLLYECLCDAFNPPCQTCDDAAVLIAEICVQDCVVIDICEMVRRFVITWPSVRYWTDIPNFQYNLNAIGQAVETLCCQLRGGCGPVTDVGTTINRLRAGSQLLMSPNAVSAEPFSQLGNLLGQLEPIATTRAVVPGGGTTLDPSVERSISEAVKTAVAGYESELASLRAEVARLAGRPA